MTVTMQTTGDQDVTLLVLLRSHISLFCLPEHGLLAASNSPLLQRQAAAKAACTVIACARTCVAATAAAAAANGSNRPPAAAAADAAVADGATVAAPCHVHALAAASPAAADTCRTPW